MRLLTRHRTYFFLSYAHSAPTSETSRSDTDAWVNVFFEDLSAAVSRRARPATGTEIGFFDQHVPVGSDWKAVLADALGAAEVFVPLYSPGYFSKSWPMRERESFLKRLTMSGVLDTERHVAPVLWIPLPSWEQAPEVDDALALGADTPEYAENGMRALCMLAAYRDRYATLLDRLARRIVDGAERTPLGPSPAPALDELPSKVDTDIAFAVAVIAPTTGDVPPGRPARSYATSSTLWRPFGEQQVLPVAEYAASTAERLGLATRIAGFDDASELLRTCPAVLLIDPWVLAVPDGQFTLRSALHGLPVWVLPLVVVDSDDPQYAERGATLADEVGTMLSDAGVPRTRSARQVQEFVDVMPGLVTEARRQYLKHGPVYPPPGEPTKRPRLTEKTDD